MSFEGDGSCCVVFAVELVAAEVDALGDAGAVAVVGGFDDALAGGVVGVVGGFPGAVVGDLLGGRLELVFPVPLHEGQVRHGGDIAGCVVGVMLGRAPMVVAVSWLLAGGLLVCRRCRCVSSSRFWRCE